MKRRCTKTEILEYTDGDEKGVCFFVWKLFSVCGVATQARLLARELAGVGYSVFLFTYPPSDPAPPCEFPLPVVDEISPHAKVVMMEYPESSFAKTVGSLQDRFSVAVFMGVPPTYQLEILKSLGKKVVVRMTGFQLNDLVTIKENQQELFSCLSSVDRFIGLSPPLSRSVAESGLDPSRLVEIHNMVDTEYYSPAAWDEKGTLRHLLNLPQDVFLITFVGNFRLAKGIDILLKAWDLIRAANKKTCLLLLGPLCSKCGGLEKPCQEKEITAARVKQAMDLLGGKFSQLIQQHERMIFAGVRENIRDYLRASDLFLFPSKREGMPNALMEAMACSLPCVTSDIEEITSDLIPSDRFGLTISGDNPKEYARAVLKLMADGDLRERLGKEARQRMKNKFSPSRIRDRYVDLLGELSLPHPAISTVDTHLCRTPQAAELET